MRYRHKNLDSSDGAMITLDLYRPIYCIPSWYLYTDCIAKLGRDLYTDRQIRAWIGSEFQWAVHRAEADTAIVVQDDELVGFIGLHKDGVIDMIAVAPEMARRGIGTLLLAWAIRESILAHLDEVVAFASPLARPLFEKHGFTIERVEKREQDGVVIKTYIMSLQLRRVNIEKYECMTKLVPHFQLQVNAKPRQRLPFLGRRWKSYDR